MVERSAPVRVTTPASTPPSSTGATATCDPDIASKYSRGSRPASTVKSSWLMTSRTWANRSTSVPSCSVTMPTGLPSSTTTAAPWARLVSRLTVSPMVIDGDTVTGVS